MTPAEELKAETIRLIQEHPLFPLFVSYGLDSLLCYLDTQPDINVAAVFGGGYDPDQVRAELRHIIAHLDRIVGRRKNLQ